MMKRLAFLMFVLWPAMAGAAACPLVWDSYPGGASADPLTLTDGSCVIAVRGADTLVVETVPTSAATAMLVVDGVAPANGDVVVLGSRTYEFDATPGLDTEVTADLSLANLVEVVNDDVDADATAGDLSLDAAAGGTLTGTTIADANTVTIGAQVFTFQAALTEADCNVLVGASDSDSLDNLIAAINGGAGSGTLYAAACTARTDSTAAAGIGDTMTLTYDTAGASGNQLVTTDTLAAGDWGAATLVGGESSIVFTARIAGTGGSDLASTTDITDASFNEATFEAGGGTDPIATVSVVHSIYATTHHQTLVEEVTDTEPMRSVIEIESPYYLVSCTGTCVFSVVRR